MDIAFSVSLKPGEKFFHDDEAVAELDGDEVLNAVVRALRLLGTVRVWDTTSLTASEIASQKKPDIIFNIAEGVYGTGREAQAPALFEWLRWPYVGSDPVTLALTLDKWYTKCLLNSVNIPTSAARLAQAPLRYAPEGLGYPVIVKPVAEGSGKGVFGSSVVDTGQKLVSVVNNTLAKYRQPAIMEEFLPGREFTVALIGNIGKWETFPLVEVNFEAFEAEKYPIFGYDAKWASPTMEDTICPARISDDLRRKIEAIAKATCDALRIRDWARVDIRLDKNGNPNVLEVNALPGILPGVNDISCFTSAVYAAGYDYHGMIHKLIDTALERYRSPLYSVQNMPATVLDEAARLPDRPVES